MKLFQTAVIIREGSVGQRIQGPAQQGVFPVDFLRVIGIPDFIQFIDGGAENVIVFYAGLLDNFNVGPIVGAQSDSTVQHQFHVAGAGGFRTGRGNLLGNIRGRNNFLRPGAIIVPDKNHLQTILCFRIVVDPVGNHINPMDDSFRPVITRGSLGAEDEGNGRQILQLSLFQLVIDCQNAQRVHKLTLVFMKAFHLDIKDHGRIEGDSLALPDFRTKLGLFLLFDRKEFFAQGRRNHRIQFLQLIKIRDKAGADFALDERAEFRIAQAQPAALGNAVGFVLETFRVQFIPFGENIVLQDFRMQRGHTVGSVGCVNGELRHMHPAVQNDAQGRRDFLSCGFHFPAEAGVDFPDNADNLRADGGEEGKIPFFQGLLHYRMVGIGKGFAGNAESIPKGYAVIAQQADQLRDCHGWMGIIQLGCHFLCKEGIIIAVTFAVGTQQILNSSGNQDILLFDPELFSFFPGVVGIEEFGDVLRPVLISGCFGIFLLIEKIKIYFVEAFCLPETKRTDVFGSVTNNRHIIGYSQNVPCFHGNNHSFIFTADRPGIPETRPVIRFLTLTAIHKGLPEEAVAEAKPVTGEGNIAGDCTVQEAGSQTAQPAIAKSVILDIFQNGRIHSFFQKKLFAVVQQAHTVQIIINQAPYQEFHGKISGLAAGKTLVFLLFPEGSDSLHGCSGDGVVQLAGRRLLPAFVRLGHQTLLRTSDQLLCIHDSLPPVCFRVQQTVFHGQIQGEHIRLHSPEPVSADGSRIIHPRFRSEMQHILHGENNGITGTVEEKTDECVRGFFLFCELQRLHGEGQRFFGGALHPAHDGVIIMGSGVGDAVGCITAGEVRIISAVEAKGEHFHTRIAAPVQKLSDTVVYTSEILSDNPDSRYLAVQRFKQILPRTDNPFSFPGIGHPVTDGIVIRKPDEVINPDHIVHRCHILHPGNPPVISPATETAPPVQGISPELAVLGKIIRRNTGHSLRNPVSIQLENFRSGPGISGIFRHINRHISEKKNSPLIAIGFQGEPLPAEQELAENMESQFIFQHFRVFANGIRLSENDLPVRPAGVHDSAEVLLDSCEKRIIHNPGVFRTETLQLSD